MRVREFGLELWASAFSLLYSVYGLHHETLYHETLYRETLYRETLYHKIIYREIMCQSSMKMSL